MSTEQDAGKEAAARAAVADVESGMTVGLGTGSTAEVFIRLLGERVSAGLDVTGVATSVRSAALAAEVGIPLAGIGAVERIDLTVDGADEVTLPALDALKGRGGALVREKLVALASDRVILIVDRSKVVDRLGMRAPVPVEVIPFGWRIPAARLAELGGAVALRRAADRDDPYVTDNGNYILDVGVGPIADAARLAERIKAISGVVDHGLFVGIASAVIIGDGLGTTVHRRQAS